LTVGSQSPRKFVTAIEIAAAAGGVIAALRNNPIKIALHGAKAIFPIVMVSP
jgi:hypothetical protein